MVKCIECKYCTRMERYEWYDYLKNGWRNEWMYYCDLDETWLTQDQAEIGECPSYVKDMDNDITPVGDE